MPNSTKKELVETISSKTGFSQVDTRMVVESFLEAVSSSLKQGRNIELRGFGRFKLRKRKAHKARNPRTGEMVHVEAGIKPVFKTSRELIARVKMAHAKEELAARSDHL
jgi:DNA-binding protein HU-beta/integration host factor subunit beta